MPASGAGGDRRAAVRSRNPTGDFHYGGLLAADRGAAINTAVRNAPRANAACTKPASRFAVLRSTTGEEPVAVAGGLLVQAGGAGAGTMSPFMVGHRGGADGKYVENTMRAFDAGAKAGAWLESDVRFTKDDVPVMLHDATIDRTTNGTGPVANYTYAKLRTFKTADGQAIPTCGRLASYLKRTKKKAFIEFKVSRRTPSSGR
jgi:hypothetical protein